MDWVCIPNKTNEPEALEESEPEELEESEPEELEESESEDEFEEPVDEEDTVPVAVRKPFNSDQCVACLSKKPELLFMNCLHRCVCLECKEMNTFHKCPLYRTHISIKVKI